MDFAASSTECGPVSTSGDAGPEEAFEWVRKALDASKVFPAMVDSNGHGPDFAESPRLHRAE